MSEQSIVWVGLPPAADLARLAAARMRVVLAASLADIEPGHHAALVILGQATRDEIELLRLQPPGAPPVIALAAPADALALLRAGAHDIVSPAVAMEELVLRIDRALETSRLRRRAHASSACVRSLEAELAQLRRTQHQLRDIVLTDNITALGNRRAFRNSLHSWLAYFARQGGEVALLAVGLDDFESVSEARGAAEADALLRRVAEWLRGSIRAADHAAHIGGGEFMLILPAANLERGRKAAERIRAALPTSASFGVAAEMLLQRGRVAPDELAARADAAVRRAKQLGKGRIEFEPRVLHAAHHQSVG